jgi:uncharacterized phiE125 gp8 family phage protein
VQPVTLDQARAHARSDAADDHLVDLLIVAATASLDGPSGELGRALMAQTWRQSLDGFPGTADPIELRLPPTIAVDTITYRDPAGAWQTLAGSEWR